MKQMQLDRGYVQGSSVKLCLIKIRKLLARYKMMHGFITNWQLANTGSPAKWPLCEFMDVKPTISEMKKLQFQ